jgi:hypothetical protein
MTTEMMEPRERVEVWKNTAAGMRWYTTLDRLGNEKGKTVQGGRTFTLTPFDRQMNQDNAASPEQDLFRNGSFVLIKPAKETIMGEIESSDSLTDAELETMVHEVMAENVTIEAAVHFIDSPVTLHRIAEQLVISDAPQSAVAFVREKKDSKEATVAQEREFVAPAPPSEPEVKTPSDIPEVETPEIVVTQPEKV